jgi:hypothetical protein
MIGIVMAHLLATIGDPRRSAGGEVDVCDRSHGDQVTGAFVDLHRAGVWAPSNAADMYRPSCVWQLLDFSAGDFALGAGHGCRNNPVGYRDASEEDED